MDVNVASMSIALHCSSMLVAHDQEQQWLSCQHHMHNADPAYIAGRLQLSSARGGLMFPAGAIIFVYKLLVMNNYTGLRNGLHGGSELVLLNRLVSVWLAPSDHAFCFWSV